VNADLKSESSVWCNVFFAFHFLFLLCSFFGIYLGPLHINTIYLGLYLQTKNTYVFAKEKTPFAIREEAGGDALWILFCSVFLA
jgi:hypothetical protein